MIVLHDCLPKKIWNQLVPRMYGHWNGDVWKAIVEARTWKNFETFTLIADHGLAIIQNKPNSNILSNEIKNFKSCLEGLLKYYLLNIPGILTSIGGASFAFNVLNKNPFVASFIGVILDTIFKYIISRTWIWQSK